MSKKEEPEDVVLRISRSFKAPRAEVFRAWTDPALLKKWWGAGPGFSTPFAEVDLRVGGKYRLAQLDPAQKEPYVVGGVFTEVIPPEKLVYTWKWEMKDATHEDTVVTVEFHERGKGTDVVLTHQRFPNKAERDEHGKGWNGCMDNLARVVEGVRQAAR